MVPKYKDVEAIPKNDADPLRLSEGEPLWRNAVSLALKLSIINVQYSSKGALSRTSHRQLHVYGQKMLN